MGGRGKGEGGRNRCAVKKIGFICMQSVPRNGLHQQCRFCMQNVERALAMKLNEKSASACAVSVCDTQTLVAEG